VLLKKPDSEHSSTARLFRALGNPTRLRILDALVNHCSHGNAGCCVIDLNKELNLPQPCVSKHLKVLSTHGFLRYHREGNKIIYSFSAPEVLALLGRQISKYSGCCQEA
jgi:ArsR family transcriptional regulator